MNILIPGNLTLTLNHLWVILMAIAVYKLIDSPLIIIPCQVLLSFMDALLRTCWQSFAYSLKGVKRRITAFGRKLIYTDGREWLLDETERQITE